MGQKRLTPHAVKHIIATSCRHRRSCSFAFVLGYSVKPGCYQLAPDCGSNMFVKNASHRVFAVTEPHVSISKQQFPSNIRDGFRRDCLAARSQNGSMTCCVCVCVHDSQYVAIMVSHWDDTNYIPLELSDPLHSPVCVSVCSPPHLHCTFSPLSRHIPCSAITQV